MFLGTFELGPNAVRTARMRKTNVCGHIRGWPNSVRTARMRKTNVFGHTRSWAQFSPYSQNAQNERFWAHSGLGPIQSKHPECGKRMFLGTFGLGPHLVRTVRMRKTKVFGHIRAWAPFSPNSQNAENECFWAHSGLGPIQSEQPECGKRMFLGTFGLGPHSVRTARMRKTKVFGHIRAWAQISPNSQNAEKRMFLGTFGLGPHSVRTARMRKTNVFGHIGAWAQFSPNSQNAENECFSAHSGLGPIQSEQPKCGKRMFLGTFGLGPNSVRTARMRKTNVFGHIRACAQFSPNREFPISTKREFPISTKW